QMNALAHEQTPLLRRTAPELRPIAGARRATRVMVVDDSRLVAEALMFTLESDPALEPIGYALDGWEALELISAFQPDALLVGSVQLADAASERLDGPPWTRGRHV